MIKIVNETLNVGEANNKLEGFVKVTNETLNIGETYNKLKGFVKVINETLNIGEKRKVFIYLLYRIVAVTIGAGKSIIDKFKTKRVK